MIKKGLKIICLCICMLFMAGCMNTKVNMNVNNDKSVDLNMNLEIDLLKFYSTAQSMFDDSTMNCQSTCDDSDNPEECVTNCMSESSTTKSEEDFKKELDEAINSGEMDFDEALNNDDLQKFKDNGYTVNANFDKQNYKYILTIAKHFNNIDDILTTIHEYGHATSTNEDKVIDLNFDGTNDKFFIKNNDIYKANYNTKDVLDNADTGNNSTDTDMNLDISDMNMDADALKEYISLTYEVSLPNKAISNNADNVSNDGKTLTWNLLNKDTLNYEFSFTNNTNNNTVTKTTKNLFNLSC